MFRGHSEVGVEDATAHTQSIYFYYLPRIIHFMLHFGCCDAMERETLWGMETFHDCILD